jgi:phosphoribosylformylglycinamidine synthase
LRALIGEAALLESAQDVSDGGLAMALAECCFASNIGATVDVEAGDFFEEDQGRAVVSCRADDVAALMQRAGEHGVAMRAIGEAGGDRLRLGTHTDEALEDRRALWEAGI